MMAIFKSLARAVEAHTSDAPTEHLEQWRAAAQQVTDAWEQWLACESAERNWAHDVYAGALAREEQAALRLERDARTLRAP